jgi:O-glycosyl hydrolase
MWRKTSALCCVALAVSLTAAAQPSRIAVDPSRQFQIIDGFGVNFNGTYFRESQKRLIDLLIDDLGATLFRLDPYGQTNWETRNENADPSKSDWDYFNDRYSTPTFEASWAAGRYLNARGIEPYLTLSGAAPEWMLETSGARPGKKLDHLRTDMYDEFAETVATLAAYARNRAHINYHLFSPVNETDCSPIEGPGVSPQEMPKLLHAIQDRLRAEGMGDLTLVVAEQCNVKNDYFGPILRDPELMKSVRVFTAHTYGNEDFGPHLERVRYTSYLQAKFWLSEYGDLKDEDRSEENEWNRFVLLGTERVLRNLNLGMSAALWWDAYDNFHEHDQRMTYYGLLKNADHVYAPKKRYFAAKQLYRYVRPGARRVETKSTGDNLLVSAFDDQTSDTVVVVGLKRGGANRVTVAAPGVKRWQVLQTTRTLDCAPTAEVAAGPGGEAEVELASEAVFTLIGSRLAEAQKGNRR